MAFTLDGPRGPRHKVKPGPVGLGKSSGLPLTTFHAAVEKAWVLNSWDRMMIPQPFSRVLVRVGKLIHVPKMQPRQDVERYTAELQATFGSGVSSFLKGMSGKVGTQ